MSHTKLNKSYCLSGPYKKKINIIDIRIILLTKCTFFNSKKKSHVVQVSEKITLNRKKKKEGKDKK